MISSRDVDEISDSRLAEQNANSDLPVMLRASAVGLPAELDEVLWPEIVALRAELVAGYGQRPAVRILVDELVAAQLDSRVWGLSARSVLTNDLSQSQVRRAEALQRQADRARGRVLELTAALERMIRKTVTVRLAPSTPDGNAAVASHAA